MIIWVKQIEDPSAFGVVQLNQSGIITDFVEKPQEFVSDLAMIGIYYFRSGEDLKQELNYLIDNDQKKGGEYQLPDALRRLTEKGTSFVPGKVSAWLDCGNKRVTVETNHHVLNFENEKGKNLVDKTAKIDDSIIIQPCFIGQGAKISRSVVGPNVSVGENTIVEDSRISNSIVQQNSQLSNLVIKDSMIGSYVKAKYAAKDLSLGDYTEMGDAN